MTLPYARRGHGAAGFSLVSAIFLMVVLAILGVSLVTLSSVQHMTSAQQVQVARAQNAVRSGIEWAVARSGQTAGCPAGATTLAPGGQLAGFTVTVTCTRTEHTMPPGPNGTTTQNYYVVDVVATSGAYGGPDYVMRRGQSKVLGPPP